MMSWIKTCIHANMVIKVYEGVFVVHEIKKHIMKCNKNVTIIRGPKRGGRACEA